MNTSDVEVNIKILLNPLMEAGKLTRGERNKLLARMTNEVAALVLRNNYLQSQAISTLEMQSAARLVGVPAPHPLARAHRRAEPRASSSCPTDEELAERRKRGLGLTRPELAVVLAYSKIWLSNHLLASDVPEDPYLSLELERYFPGPVRERFPRAIPRHRLRREIIATATTNSLVNRMGPTFVARTQEETGAEPAEIARAYTAAREIFDMRKLWARIEALDNRITAKLQYGMMYQTSRLLRHVTYWLLAHRRRELHVDKAVARVPARRARARSRHRPRARRRRSRALREGAQGARRCRRARGAGERASRASTRTTPRSTSWSSPRSTRRASSTLRASTSRSARASASTGCASRSSSLPVEGPWQAVARTGLRDSALRIHRRLAERVLARGTRGPAQARVTAWVESLGEELAHWQRTLRGHAHCRRRDFATLTVGVETVRKLAD